MLCCKLNRRRRGSDIFLISAQNIDVGESEGEVIHGCSHNILFHLAMLILWNFHLFYLNQELAFYRHYKESFEYEDN